jgi:hypothetical protein
LLTQIQQRIGTQHKLHLSLIRLESFLNTLFRLVTHHFFNISHICPKSVQIGNIHNKLLKVENIHYIMCLIVTPPS